MMSSYSEQDTSDMSIISDMSSISFITLPPNHCDSILVKYIPIYTTKPREYIYTFIEDLPIVLFTQICELFSRLPILRPVYINNIYYIMHCILADMLTELEVTITLTPYTEIPGFIIPFGYRIYIMRIAFINGDYHAYADTCEYIESLLTAAFYIHKL